MKNLIRLKKIFLLFDSRHLIKPIDKVIIESLLEIQTNEINFIFTKVDKIKSLEKKKKNKKIKKIKKKTTPPPTPASEAAREARPVGSLPSVRIV